MRFVIQKKNLELQLDNLDYRVKTINYSCSVSVNELFAFLTVCSCSCMYFRQFSGSKSYLLKRSTRRLPSQLQILLKESSVPQTQLPNFRYFRLGLKCRRLKYILEMAVLQTNFVYKFRCYALYYQLVWISDLQLTPVCCIFKRKF